MLASGAKASAEEVEEEPQEGHGLDGEGDGGLSVFRTYSASNTIFLPDDNSSTVSSLPLTITVLYRLWFLISDVASDNQTAAFSYGEGGFSRKTSFLEKFFSETGRPGQAVKTIASS
jgi:hypothetical protein